MDRPFVRKDRPFQQRDPTVHCTPNSSQSRWNWKNLSFIPHQWIDFFLRKKLKSRLYSCFQSWFSRSSIHNYNNTNNKIEFIEFFSASGCPQNLPISWHFSFSHNQTSSYFFFSHMSLCFDQEQIKLNPDSNLESVERFVQADWHRYLREIFPMFLQSRLHRLRSVSTLGTGSFDRRRIWNRLNWFSSAVTRNH